MAFFYAFLGLDVENSVNYCVFSFISPVANICMHSYFSSGSLGRPLGAPPLEHPTQHRVLHPVGARGAQERGGRLVPCHGPWGENKRLTQRRKTGTAGCRVPASPLACLPFSRWRSRRQQSSAGLSTCWQAGGKQRKFGS